MTTPPPRLLITAGPTHEPIDAVRYLGNRSSGRLGIALAEAAAARTLPTTLLLGPTCLTATDPRVQVVRFRTTSDLQRLLTEHWPSHDALVMAAAVADYRPAQVDTRSKLRRSQDLTLVLEPTPDLLAQASARARAGQLLVGFALEPRERLEASAREKLERKGVHLVVANPLETMDSPEIQATILARGTHTPIHTPGTMDKPAFASWLLDTIILPRLARTDLQAHP